jgi:hypothetical protein
MTTRDLREAPLPSQILGDARDVASALDARLQRKAVPVRAAFISSPSAAELPAMTRLLRGGRGGEVKLKLLLSMIWVAAAEPFDVTHPARAWAQLIGLPDPESKGAARVNAASRRLVEAGFLAVEKRPGKPSRLILRNETGTGLDYEHPGAAWELVKDADQRARRRTPRYVNIPKEFWTRGWVATLGGPAVAMLLILMESSRGRPMVDLWFAPSVASTRYGLNEATRKKGLDELEKRGLITTYSAIVRRDPLSIHRRRNTYTVLEENFDTNPEDLNARVAAIREATGVTASIRRLGLRPLENQTVHSSPVTPADAASG